MRRSGSVFAATAAAVVLMSSAIASAQSSFSAILPDGEAGDEQTSVIYNPGTGAVGIDAPASVGLTSLNINSADAIFAGNPMNLEGDFDIFDDDTIFKATFGSEFGTLSFGFVAPIGLEKEFVLNDFTVDGSLATGGGLGDVDLVYIPEPSSCVLMGMGLLAMAGMTRRRSRTR